MSAGLTQGRGDLDARRRAVESYLRILLGPWAPHGWLELRVRHGASGMRQRFYQAEDVELAARAILTLGQRSDVYVGVAPRAERAGGKSAIKGAWVLWADCDDPMAATALEHFDSPPTLIVASGSPSHLHLYWALRELASPAVIEHANRRLAYALGADRTSVDIGRVLRPPETMSFKSRPPRRVELLEIHETRRYAPGEVAGLLADPPLRPTRLLASPASADPDRDGLPPFLPHWLRSIPPVLFVHELTGLQPNSEGKVRCPFHDDVHPSMHLYESDWYCFGCRRGGSIVDFVSALWGLHSRGQQALEIRERLIARFSEPQDHRDRSIPDRG
jgi:CHC2 zinc finger/RepB DNA-primase from phage plasmid